MCFSLSGCVGDGMKPDFWDTVRILIANGEPDEALARIAANWDASGTPTPESADAMAAAIAGTGDLVGALAPLNAAIESGTANFHTYFRLAEYHRRLGQIKNTLINHRLAHAQFGWPESLAHGYSFTHDYFSPNILIWENWFRVRITAKPIEALEIGSWQGGSATWLLDKVISPRGGRLTCIDGFEGSSEHVGLMETLGTRLEDIFDDNIERTGHGDKLRKLVGRSQVILPTLWGENFDFIYIDGAHEAKFVIQDAVFSWGLLKPGGFMLFDDVGFKFADHPEQNTGRAIDFFVSVFGDEIQQIDCRGQLLLQRSK